MALAAPPKAAPPPLPPKANGATPQPNAAREFKVQLGLITGAQRVLLYGPGGIGKSSLAGLAPNPIFLDIEEGTHHMDVPRISGISDFADLRACLQSHALDSFKTIVIDSATKAEEWAIANTIQNVLSDNKHRVTSIEGYGFGKGYQHVYDTFLLLLADLDSQVRAGRNVILIAHDCIANVPNPVSEDYIRYEPHLQAPKSGKASIRNRVIQWADYVLSVGYDVISEDGKGKGGGTRTIFTVERPDRIAKSRTSIEPLPFTSATDGEIWTRICGDNA
jgi:hypothetical protein